MKFFVDDPMVFSLAEESEFFRLKVDTPAIETEHVEDFLDITVEWLSGNPTKGLLIDFDGVKSVCGDFTVYLTKYYEDIKKRGLHVRFVNVDPSLKPYVDVSNITVVINLEDLKIPPEPKAVVSAKQILKDLKGNLSNRELMDKHGLSRKGLASMFRKLLGKGIISRRMLASRLGVETGEITLMLEGIQAGRVKVDAGEVLNDLSRNLSDDELMRKYRLSEKGLESLLRKLHEQGFVSRDYLRRRKTTVH